MAGLLEGKVALISGAARGQGRSHALTLAREGAEIIAIDIANGGSHGTYPFATAEDLQETERLVKEIGVRVVTGRSDVRDRDETQRVVDEAVAQLGRLDIVLANAGTSAMGPWEQVSESDWVDTLAINLTGVWNTLRAGTPHLIAAGGGAMVATSSTLGLVGRPFFAAYTASKHGVVGLVRSMALELAPHNIRVNTVHPTGIDTVMLQSMGGMDGLFSQAPAMAPLFENALPTPLVEEQDISNAILYLVADSGRYVTGAHLPVDAGFTTR